MIDPTVPPHWRCWWSGHQWRTVTYRGWAYDVDRQVSRDWKHCDRCHTEVPK